MSDLDSIIASIYRYRELHGEHPESVRLSRSSYVDNLATMQASFALKPTGLPDQVMGVRVEVEQEMNTMPPLTPERIAAAHRAGEQATAHLRHGLEKVLACAMPSITMKADGITLGKIDYDPKIEALMIEAKARIEELYLAAAARELSSTPL